MQYNTKEYSTIQYEGEIWYEKDIKVGYLEQEPKLDVTNTIQDRQYATPRYFTTQHIRTNTQYIMLISFPALTLDYLHCIASNYILLHYIALQYISLHYNPLRYTTLHCNDVIPRVLTGTHTYRYIHRNMDVYINTLILA